MTPRPMAYCATCYVGSTDGVCRRAARRLVARQEARLSTLRSITRIPARCTRRRCRARAGWDCTPARSSRSAIIAPRPSGRVVDRIRRAVAGFVLWTTCAKSRAVAAPAHLAACGRFAAAVCRAVRDLLLTAAATLAIAWMANLYNFMDGSDGLAGGMALFGFFVLRRGRLARRQHRVRAGQFQHRRRGGGVSRVQLPSGAHLHGRRRLGAARLPGRRAGPDRLAAA